jgi:hypothetical protein
VVCKILSAHCWWFPVSPGNGHARGPNQDRHLLLLRLLVWGRRQVADALMVVVRVVVAGKQGGALRSSRRPDQGLLVSGAGAAGVGIEGVSLSGFIDEAPGLSTRSVRAYKPGEARRAPAIRPVGAAPRRDSPRPRCGVATRIWPLSIDLGECRFAAPSNPRTFCPACG